MFHHYYIFQNFIHTLYILHFKFWEFQLSRLYIERRKFSTGLSNARSNHINAGIRFRMRILLNEIIDDGQIAIYCRSEGIAYGHGIVSRQIHDSNCCATRVTDGRHAPTYTNKRIITSETLLPRSYIHTYVYTQVVLHMTGISRGRTGLREIVDHPPAPPREERKFPP